VRDENDADHEMPQCWWNDSKVREAKKPSIALDSVAK
jgi:hypothetical protein